MTSKEGGLTDAQRELIEHLPATPEELAEKLGISRSAIASRADRAREKGAEIRYSRSDGIYYTPGDESEFDVESAERYISRPDGLVTALRNEGLTAAEAEERFDLTQRSFNRLREQMRQEGFVIEFEEVDEQGTRIFYIPENTDKSYELGDGDGTYRFALIGDTHLGSAAEHLNELHDFYDRVQDRGIDLVFHAGDVTDGWKVYRGQINEVKPEATGWGRMRDYAVQNYPSREGVDTLFIEGNHDHKFYKKNGIRLGQQLDDKRPDLHYLGDSQAVLVLDSENDIDLELIHPSGGKPYTAGYRAQTLYRERDVENRPTFAAIGHIHGKAFLDAEDVQSFYVGCWQGQTTYGKRRGNQTRIGGWIVEVEIVDGAVRRVVPEWIGFEASDESTTYTETDIAEKIGREV